MKKEEYLELITTAKLLGVPLHLAVQPYSGQLFRTIRQHTSIKVVYIGHAVGTWHRFQNANSPVTDLYALDEVIPCEPDEEL